MPRVVLIRHPMHDLKIAQDLLPSGWTLEFVDRDGPDFDAMLKDVEYLVGYFDKQMDDAFFKKAPKLKLMQLISAGYDKVNIEAAHRAGMAVCNNGGANSGPVAEHAFLLMLALARQLFRQHEDVVTGRWQRNNMSAEVFTLQGRMLGIVGLGTIGKKAARLGRAFGMDVQYYDIVRLSEDAEGQLGARFRLLDEILKTSDFVSLHIPYTPATKRMFGLNQFKLMKKTAYFINTARGEVVNEPELYQALKDGLIAGAGLDVFEKEPPDTSNPIFQMKNVVLSAHLAGPIWDTQYQKFRNSYDNIARVQRGERPLWLIPELQGTKLRIDSGAGR